jgi:hypothetical protein
VIGWAVGFLLPLLAALVVASRVTPRERLAIAIPLAAIAIGLASVVAFVLLTAGVNSRSAFIALDAGVWLVLAGVALRIRHRALSVASSISHAEPMRTEGALAIAIGILLAAVTAIALVWFVASSSVYPHGEWDAWAQWNLRARFVFLGFEDGTWRNAFASVLAWSHPDYPMLVPMSVARLWLYGGSDSVIAPVGFAGCMAAATVGAAALSVAHTRGAARGCLTAAVILACPSFVRYSAAQCADVAVGLYLLSAFVLWAQAERATEKHGYWILAGTAAALCGWTKNEGLAAFGLFAILVAGERLWQARDVRAAGLVLAGAAPVLLVIVAFKLTLAPPSYFTSEQSLAQAVASLTDLTRIRVVASAFAREVWLTGASTVGILPVLAVFAAIRGLDRTTPVAAHLAIPAMVILLTVYAAAYLVTPKDLAWQLQTSLDRLVLQIVPTLAWAVVTLCR